MTINDRAVFWTLSGILFLLVFFNICIIDDAYLSFRVVDNAANGFGLRWNVDERVQVFTHPLWLLLHIPLYAVFPNIYWVTILLSLGFGIAAVTMLSKLVRGYGHPTMLILILLPLFFSRIFRNYVVCGLENPLSFFLIAYLLWEVFGKKEFSLYRFLFVAALAVITRFDNAIMIAPLTAMLMWTYRSELRIGKLLAAGSPIILWHGFSLFYYGFLFPNTKYAKLSMGVSTQEYLNQGLIYLLNFPKTDPLACLITLAALYLCLRRRDDWRFSLLGMGMLLHIGYVISVGGDFMPGRFFANVVIASVAIVAMQLAPWMQFRKHMLAALLLFTAFDQLIIQPNLPDRKLEQLNGGIDDQHDWYYPASGMLSQPEHFLRREPTAPWLNLMKAARVRQGERFHYVTRTASGMKFYYAGPYFIILDTVGLADALMARLPTGDLKNWRIGHPIRKLPEGYLTARQTGDTSGMQPALAKYYEKMRMLTEDDLFSRERIHTIFRFQFGVYDDLLAEYVRSQQ